MTALEKKLLIHLQANPFVLAPMAGITDSPFRKFMRELGAGIVISELISAQGLKYKSQKTFDMLKFDEGERPVGIQLFGESPEVLAEAAKIVQDTGVDFIDLNFGCPVNKVVKKGAGAAATRDLVEFGKILRAVKSALSIPLTIKIRTGWDSETRNAVDTARVAYEEGITWVAIHGRTRAQGYNGESDWSFIRYVKESSKVCIIGNGDITTPDLARSRLLESNCDGVMIGRGCLKNPLIFQQAMGVDKSLGILELVKKLNDYLSATHPEKFCKIQLRKFAMWYSFGFPEASAFRRELFSQDNIEELKRLIESYFHKVQNLNRVVLTQDAFLMGGHG